MVAEEGEEDMAGTSEFMAGHDLEIKGAVGENAKMVVADVAESVTTEDVGSENNSVSMI